MGMLDIDKCILMRNSLCGSGMLLLDSVYHKDMKTL